MIPVLNSMSFHCTERKVTYSPRGSMIERSIHTSTFNNGPIVPEQLSHLLLLLSLMNYFFCLIFLPHSSLSPPLSETINNGTMTNVSPSLPLSSSSLFPTPSFALHRSQIYFITESTAFCVNVFRFHLLAILLDDFHPLECEKIGSTVKKISARMDERGQNVVCNSM